MTSALNAPRYEEQSAIFDRIAREFAEVVIEEMDPDLTPILYPPKLPNVTPTKQTI